MIPDIIVHRRGRNDANFLVIEVKKEGARFEGIEYDFQKLMYFTDSRGEYYYKYEFWIEIGLNSVNVVLFQEGNIVEKMSWKMSEGSNQKSNIIKKIIGY